METGLASVVGDVDVDAINELVVRARTLPSIADRYVDVEPIEHGGDLVRLPTMSTDTVATVFPDLIRSAHDRKSGAFIFSSGGTTASPRHSLVPAGLLVEPMTRDWRPFAADDVVLNTFDAGRGWSVHYLTNGITMACGAVSIPFGRLEPAEYERQFALWSGMGLSTVAGTPTTLEGILQHFHSRGEQLPFRTMLWAGEPWSKHGLELVEAFAGSVKLWSMYGATESWVVGVNTPDCDLHVFHLIDGVVADFDESHRGYVTSWANDAGLVLRYDMGDRIHAATCACGRLGIGLSGRADNRVKLFGSLFDPDAMIAAAIACPGVAKGQLRFSKLPDGREHVVLSVVPTDDASPDLEAQVLRAVLAEFNDLNSLVAHSTESLIVERVAALVVDRRTGKTASVVRSG